jgi:hypothetical protein
MIERREWVPGGMSEIMEMMIDSFAYFDSLVALATFQPLSCHQYSWALGYTLASMWTMAYNARIAAIETMTISDYQSIELEQFYLADQFKTSNIYSYQIINTTDVVKIFVKYIRKHVISPECDSGEAVLFPSWKGTPLAQGEASKKFSNIFRRYGYNLTVTRLRSIISTHVEEKFKKNEISQEEYIRFITTGQTHTISTHRKYYVKKRKYEEGQQLLESYQKIFPAAPVIQDYYDDNTNEEDMPLNDIISSCDDGNPAEESFIAPCSSSHTLYAPPCSSYQTLPSDTLTTPPYSSHTLYIPSSHPLYTPSFYSSSHTHTILSGGIDGHESRVFGMARTDIGEKKKKFDWIDEEINYLVEYIQNIAPSLPGAEKNRYATCLSFLKTSAPDEAIQFFHPHHLRNSDRLKNGYLRALQTIANGDGSSESEIVE